MAADFRRGTQVEPEEACAWEVLYGCALDRRLAWGKNSGVGRCGIVHRGCTGNAERWGGGKQWAVVSAERSKPEGGARILAGPC
jgi:hypothetical protein